MREKSARNLSSLISLLTKLCFLMNYHFIKKKKASTQNIVIFLVVITLVSVLGEEILDLREEESMKG